ncbi:MAG: Glycosyltransferase family 9 (heptosyltransferase), partial [Chlorobi bacterium OLB7]
MPNVPKDGCAAACCGCCRGGRAAWRGFHLHPSFHPFHPACSPRSNRDAIITTASIQLVRQRFPNATIGLLLGAKKNAAVAELIPDINRTHVVPVSAVGTWKVMRAIRRTRYDFAINLVANDSASAAALTALSGAVWKIGFAGKSSTLYDAAIPRAAGPIHIVRETSLLLAPLGISPIGPQPLHNGQRLRIRLNQEAEASGTVVLNISGSEPAKYWGTKNFTALCGLLRQAGRGGCRCLQA